MKLHHQTILAALVTLALIAVLALFAIPASLLSQAEPADPHAGQPASCDNYRKTAPTHRCACNRATECPDGHPRAEDSKCKTYCRPKACGCLHPCTS